MYRSTNQWKILDNEVKEIYYKNYWLPLACEKMTPKFAALCFDIAVNIGGRVKKILKAARYKYPEKFIGARRAKYYEFLKYGNQKILEWLVEQIK